MKNLKLFSGILLGLFFLTNCSFFNFGKDKSPQYQFEKDGNKYSIRSAFPKKEGKSYIQLIGKGLVCVDIDSDGILDRTQMGELSLTEAQKIYDYGIAILVAEQKVNLETVLYYLYFDSDSTYNYELKSFQLNDTPIFNEFIIINKENNSSSEIVLLDQNADGTLDEFLKGVGEVETYQPNYDYVIESGIDDGKLLRTVDQILVRKLLTPSE